jgi:hypothetical protein
MAIENYAKKVMERRLRNKVDASSPVLTDQSMVKNQDINNIMKKYQKTGVLPQTRQALAQYLDVSEVPSLEEAHEAIIEARNMFNELPSDVRKLMDNDPTKLHEYCSNPENADFLVKRGVLDKIELPAQEVAGDASIPKPKDEPQGE